MIGNFPTLDLDDKRAGNSKIFLSYLRNWLLLFTGKLEKKFPNRTLCMVRIYDMSSLCVYHSDWSIALSLADKVLKFALLKIYISCQEFKTCMILLV